MNKMLTRREFARLLPWIPFAGLIAQRTVPRFTPALRYFSYSHYGKGTQATKVAGWIETTAGRIVGYVDHVGRRLMIEPAGNLRLAPEWTAPMTRVQ